MRNNQFALANPEQFIRAASAWQTARTEGDVARKALANSIQLLAAYARGQGYAFASRYYTDIIAMEYQALFQLERVFADHFRDTLTTAQNNNLAAAERIAQRAIQDGMDSRMPHKAVYRLAKQRVILFAELVGRTRPGDDRILM